MTTSDPAPGDDGSSPEDRGTSSDGGGPAGATVAPPRSWAAGRSRWWRTGLAALALAGLVGAATAVDGGTLVGKEERPGTDDAATTSAPGKVVPVGSAALACPGGSEVEDATVEVAAAQAPQSVLSVAAAPGSRASSGSSLGSSPEVVPDAGPEDEESDANEEGARLVLSGDGDDGQALRPPRPGIRDLPGGSAAFVVGRGSAAPGLVGAQLAVGTGAGVRGAGLAPCVRAAEELWLVGGGGGAGATELLVLTNPGPDPVTVAVRVWGADGEVATTGATGLVVPPGGRADHQLDALAPGVEAPVVAVSATGGPVAAHLNLLVRDGTTDRGAGTVAPAGAVAPARDLVLPALPSAPDGSSHRTTLRLLAPGVDGAVVDVTALTEDGAVRLPDLVTRLASGRTLEVDLEGLPAGTTGLRLRSDAPVVAAAGLEVDPQESEPQEASVDDAVATGAAADGAAATDSPDDEAVATDPSRDEAVATDGPADDAPADDAAATTVPGTDTAGITGRPPRGSVAEPLVRTAGELAWVSATVPTPDPVGTALPDPAAVPGGAARLVLSAVDATTATVHWLDQDGGSGTEDVELANDTGRLLDVPAGTRAVWITTTDPRGAAPGAGVVAAVHVSGADGRGPFLAAATLPVVPWTTTVTTVRPAVP